MIGAASVSLILSTLTGLLLTALSVAVHAAGTTRWIRHLCHDETRHHEELDNRIAGRGTKLSEEVPIASLTTRSFKVMYSTAVALVLLHIVEVLIWAAAYRLLPQIQSLATFEEAVYFSAVAFATIGFGDVVIDGHWRMLGAIQGMVGVLLFGWSTALLFAVVQRLWRQEQVDHGNRGNS